MDSLKSNLGSFCDLDTCSQRKLLVAVLSSSALAYVSYTTISSYLHRRRMIALIKDKRRQRDESISIVRRQLGQNVDDSVRKQRERIVELPFEELRERLQDGRLTAVAVLEAFQWRALEAHQQTNFACEFLAEARKWAEQLDARYGGKGRNEKPPLFGIPFSNKESNFIVGHDATVGCPQFIGQPVDKDNELVALLKQAGAVPFMLTNLPQTTMSLGSSNPVYGTTTNPYDKTRSSGGSTSGEAAVLAFRGSPFGLGGDIGGSVRVPAHFCGISALKPTVGRLVAAHNNRSADAGFTALKPTYGPMAPDVDALAWFMRVMCAKGGDAFSLHPYTIPLPFDEEQFQGDGRPLTIGYYDHDNWLTAAPACRRAVSVAKQILEKNGHRLVPVPFPLSKKEMRRLMECYVTFAFPDGGTQLIATVNAGIPDPGHEHLVRFTSWPIWFRKIRGVLATSPYWRTAYAASEGNTSAMRKKVVEVDEFKAKFVEFWSRYKLDCVICPVLATPAIPAHVIGNLFCVAWSYCAVYNLVNFTAGVVKCTRVTAADEKAAFERPPIGKEGLEGDGWVTKLLRQCQKGSVNLPVGVQVVTLPFREELCLRVMKEIESALEKK